MTGILVCSQGWGYQWPALVLKMSLEDQQYLTAARGLNPWITLPSRMPSWCFWSHTKPWLQLVEGPLMQHLRADLGPGGGEATPAPTCASGGGLQRCQWPPDWADVFPSLPSLFSSFPLSPFSSLFPSLEPVSLLYTERQCWKLSVSLFQFCWAVCSEHYRVFSKQAIRGCLKTTCAAGRIPSPSQYSYDAITTATKPVNNAGEHGEHTSSWFWIGNKSLARLYSFPAIAGSPSEILFVMFCSGV